MSGNNVAHSNVKTKRKFRPNLQRISLFSNLLERNLRFKLCRTAVRTIEKYGGIDEFFLRFRANKLTPLGQKYRLLFIRTVQKRNRAAKLEKSVA